MPGIYSWIAVCLPNEIDAFLITEPRKQSGISRLTFFLVSTGFISARSSFGLGWSPRWGDGFRATWDRISPGNFGGIAY